MLSANLDDLETRAHNVMNAILSHRDDGAIPSPLAGEGQGEGAISVIEGTSQVGSGSVPAEMMPTRLLSVKPVSMTAEVLARKLRHYSPPIFTRIHQEAVLFDFRTIQPDEDAVVAKALLDILGSN